MHRAGEYGRDDTEQYIAASGRLHYAGGGRLWIVDPGWGRVLEAPEEAGLILKVADRFRTLREHRRALLDAGWQDDGSDTLDALLSSLARSGALRARSELLRRIQEAPPEPPPPPIAAIAWITRDRPELLSRSIESAIANLKLYGRRVELKVYDDSADTQAREVTRAMLAELGGREGYAVFYAGLEEKRKFAAALQAGAEGVAAEIIEFALFNPYGIGYAPGANSNAVLLDTRGQLVLHTDDDSVFRFASLPEAGPGLRLSSAADPMERRFFADQGGRERAVELRDVDILAAHQALLGRPVTDCLRACGVQVYCEEMAPEFFPVLESAGARVATTMAGVCGDSGLGSPLSVLWLTGASREQAMAAEASYRDALRSREILRSASRATIGQGTFLMNMHCGMDNRLALPPFLPVLRNADGLFAQLLRLCLPAFLIAYLPEAVLHLPAERRAFAWEPRIPPRLSDLLGLMARALAPAQWAADGGQGLRAIGGGLVQVARRKISDFQELLRELWTAEMSRYAMSLEQLLDRFGGEPGYWAADAHTWLEQTHRFVTAKEPLVPHDLANRGSGSEAVALAQKVVRDYGELLLAWPALQAQSATLASAGKRMAKQLPLSSLPQQNPT